MDKEQWKAIPGWVGFYEVSTYGRVRSVDRIRVVSDNGHTCLVRGRLMALSKAKKRGGYLTVSLYRDNKATGYRVNRLVALAFIPNPWNKPEVNHKDTNKENNHVSNLEWVTPKENSLHSAVNGRRPAKLTPDTVRRIRSKLNSGQSKASIGREESISPSTIRFIELGKYWSHVV